MGRLRNKTKERGPKEEVDIVEIEYVEVKRGDYERRVVALIQALLEIDGTGARVENSELESKEAA